MRCVCDIRPHQSVQTIQAQDSRQPRHKRFARREHNNDGRQRRILQEKASINYRRTTTEHDAVVYNVLPVSKQAPRLSFVYKEKFRV